MNIEEWKQIPIFSKYEVSNTGCVRRTTAIDMGNGDIIYKYKGVQQHSVRTGEVVVTLSHKSVTKLHYVHRLVAELFIPNPNPNLCKVVKHIDGDKLNNHVSNLMWYNSFTEKINKKKSKSQLEFERLKEELAVILAMPNEP